MSLVFDHYPRGGGELLTALALADHADHQGGNVRPGIASLARKTRQSERTIQHHMARMRRDTWLLPVRYLRGGHGRATEYRVNPDWLDNPARFAPFAAGQRPHTTVQSDTERVQMAVLKGESDGALGCHYFAPQPSGTVKETTTTAAAVDSSQSVVGMVTTETELPAGLQGPLAPSARRLLADCPASDRVAVLHEVAGIMSRGRLRGSPIGLLHRMVERARAGTFVPSLGIPGVERQRVVQQARMRTLEAPCRAADTGPRAVSELATEALAKIRAKLTPRPTQP